jgi:hypothetical protein
MNLYCKGPIKITLGLPRKLSPAEMTFLRPPQIVHPENTTNQRSRSNLTRLHHHPVAMGSSRLQRNSVQASNVTPSLRATDVNSHGRPGFDSQYPRPIFFSCKKKVGLHPSMRHRRLQPQPCRPLLWVRTGSCIRQPRRGPSHASIAPPLAARC